MRREIVNGMTRRYFIACSAGAAGIAAIPSLNVAQAEGSGTLDDFIRHLAAAHNIPGIAVAVVKDGKVVHAKGYGVRKQGSADLVDANTVFSIGSATKSFTAALVGLLVEDGKLKWDDPLVKHIPEFGLKDTCQARQITLRDLLTHSSGIMDLGGLLAVIYPKIETTEILSRLAHTQPQAPLRTAFSYNNTGYLLAGEAAARAAGSSWDELVHTRLLAPLGMSRATTHIADLSAMTNVSVPHEVKEGQNIPIKYRDLTAIAPAGAINASVLDMAKWLLCHLDDGSVSGRQILSKSTVDELHRGQFLIKEIPAFRRIVFNDSELHVYGLGWFRYLYQGRMALYHTGGIDGNTAIMGMIPGQRLGVIVLINQGYNTSAVSAVLDYVFGSYAGLGDGTDWVARSVQDRKASDDEMAHMIEMLNAKRAPDKPPSFEVSLSAGLYQNEVFGDVRVRADNGILWCRLGGLSERRLEHWSGNTFRLPSKDFGAGDFPQLLTFDADKAGPARAVTWDAFGHDIRFERSQSSN